MDDLTVQPGDAPDGATPALRDTTVEHEYLWDFLLVLVRGWRLLLIAMGLGLGFAALVTALSTPRYLARVALAPVASNSGGSNGFSAAQALLAGTLGKGPTPAQFGEFLFLTKSLPVAALLVKKNGVLQKIFATEWDTKTGQWHEPRRGAKAFLQGMFGIPAWTPPSAAALSQFLGKRLVTKYDRAPIVELRFVSRDRKLALQLLQDIVAETDAYMRQTETAESERRFDYLTAKLRTVNLAELRGALTELLFQQERKLMLLQSDSPIAARVLAGPQVSDLPVEPNAALNLALGLVGGFTLGVFLVFGLASWKRYRATGT